MLYLTSLFLFMPKLNLGDSSLIPLRGIHSELQNHYKSSGKKAGRFAPPFSHYPAGNWCHPEHSGGSPNKLTYLNVSIEKGSSTRQVFWQQCILINYSESILMTESLSINEGLGGEADSLKPLFHCNKKAEPNGSAFVSVIASLFYYTPAASIASIEFCNNAFVYL